MFIDAKTVRAEFPNGKHRDIVVKVNGQDVTHITKSANDEEGWVEVLILLAGAKTQVPCLFLKDQNKPVTAKVFGQVEICLPAEAS